MHLCLNFCRARGGSAKATYSTEHDKKEVRQDTRHTSGEVLVSRLPSGKKRMYLK